MIVVNPATRLLQIINEWESHVEVASVMAARTGENPSVEQVMREAFTAYWELSDWCRTYSQKVKGTELYLNDLWDYLLSASVAWDSWSPLELNKYVRAWLESFSAVLDTSLEFRVLYTPEQLRPIREALVEIGESIRNVRDLPDKFVSELLTLIGRAIQLIDTESTPSMQIRSSIFEATGAYYAVADKVPEETRNTVERRWREIAATWFRDVSTDVVGGILSGAALGFISA